MDLQVGIVLPRYHGLCVTCLVPAVPCTDEVKGVQDKAGRFREHMSYSLNS